jgi:hypothetical protein
MRVRLEQALQATATKRGLKRRVVGIGELTTALTNAKALSAEILADLLTVSVVSNSAVHGQEIKAEEARAALQLGNSLLARLQNEG